MQAGKLVVLGLALLGAAGCGQVDRLLVVESVPAQAELYLDGEYCGLTPHSERFTFYGTHLVELRKRGYSSLARTVDVSCPWYLCFPLDFFCENVLPVSLSDRHVFSFALAPYEEEAEAIVERAKRLLDRPARVPPLTPQPAAR